MKYDREGRRMNYDPLPDFYCKKHRYTPPENSGMAFCPMCEGLEVELVDGKYSIDGIEVGPPGQELTVNDDVDERWDRWRHTKLGRIYCGKYDPKILRTVFAAGSDWEHPDYKTGIKNASISGGENERRTTLNR